MKPKAKYGMYQFVCSKCFHTVEFSLKSPKGICKNCRNIVYAPSKLGQQERFKDKMKELLNENN